MKRLLLIPMLALGACTAAQTAQVNADINTASAGASAGLNIAQTAANSWPVVKGLLGIAAAADPKLAPQINAAIPKIDAGVAQLQAYISAGNAALPAAQALASQIMAQTAAIQTLAAPAIVVVPSK